MFYNGLLISSIKLFKHTFIFVSVSVYVFSCTLNMNNIYLLQDNNIFFSIAAQRKKKKTKEICSVLEFLTHSYKDKQTDTCIRVEYHMIF